MTDTPHMQLFMDKNVEQMVRKGAKLTGSRSRFINILINKYGTEFTTWLESQGFTDANLFMTVKPDQRAKPVKDTPSNSKKVPEKKVEAVIATDTAEAPHSEEHTSASSEVPIVV